MKEREYMYVFVRTDLSIPQQIVQSSHASACIGEKYHSDTNIVLIGIENEEKLKVQMEYLKSSGIGFHPFFEPDIMAYTSIASEPVSGQQRKIFKKYKIM